MVGFIDSDDLYYPDHVETLVNLIKTGENDFVIGSFELIHDGPEPMIIDFFNQTKTIPISQVDCSTGTMFGIRQVFRASSAI